mgnify:CR=1 FL=1
MSESELAAVEKAGSVADAASAAGGPCCCATAAVSAAEPCMTMQTSDSRVLRVLLVFGRRGRALE